jgi:hypothetical protein
MRPRSACIAAFALTAVLAVGGCAAPPQASHGPSVSAHPGEAGALVGNQGASWEVVLPGGSSTPRLAAGPEQSRRDAELGLHSAGLVEDSYWPDGSPRVQNLRRFWLTGSPREVLYHGAWPYIYSPRPSRYWGW